MEARDVLKLIAAEYQIPEHMLLGYAQTEECLCPKKLKDVERYYNHVNATRKGLRRKMRRLKAFVSKMARKKR